MARREMRRGDAGKSSKSVLILSSSDDEDANEDLRLKGVEKALLMRAAKLAPDDAVLGETSGGGGGSSAVVAPSSALEDEVVEVPGGVGGNDVIVGSGAGDLGKKKKVVKRVRKKIKKMEVGEQTVIVAKDEEKEETVEALDIVESVELTAVEITDNIVFRKLAPDDTVLRETSGGGGGSSGVVVLSSSSALEDEVVEVPGGVSGNDVIVGSGAGDLGKKKKVLKRARKKKIKKMEVGEQTVIVAKDEEKEETVKASDIVESLEPTAVEVTDNIVFRKLLRGPRYFDPPDSGWGKCFNCGEEGHTVANCTAVKRKKPCFVCGSLEHSAKQCSKGQDCFICKKGGHRAKDCPEKHNGGYPSLKICLKCGDSGHDMFTCWNGYYSPDDLKGIQCYICDRFGHLCCSNSVNSNTSPRVISCYKCGQLGHTGLACAKIHGEDTGTWSSSSCYKCGEEGHFARECMSSAKANKRSREFSTPTLRFHREEKDYSEFKSVPLDLGKVRKRKKTRNDEKGIATPQKSKRRGGWIVEDPGDFSHRKSEKGSWRSPATPSSKGRKIAGITAGGHISGSQSSKKSSTVLSGSSTSQGWSKGFQHRFSPARFGNSGSEGMQRNYNWW